MENKSNNCSFWKKKRAKEKDIPYMTQEWKKALRNKRK